ncbi:uncharacterized protein [Ptychodera flava]|uniref:uncharacterized protein n=1 Tax=Ptychodera flava TaxID=63121 RepID=UPI00396A3F27
MELGLRQQASPQSQIDPCSAPDVHAITTPDTIPQEGTVEDTRSGQDILTTSNANTNQVSNSVAIDQDLWKQLKRVSIPTFSGDKRRYENWKAAFNACIDQSPATPEYKLLQLRQYLSREALKVIENLGHSAIAYEAAKERLERKYGGKRRQIALYLEELDNFKPIRTGYSRDIERFADLLDIAVVNLKESGRNDELGNGSLYTKLQKKMTESMLTQYHRWIFEKNKVESVETLRDWIIQEAEFQTIASETVQGLTSTNTKIDRRARSTNPRTYFGRSENRKPVLSGSYRSCKVCDGKHGVWSCDQFKKMGVSQRWDAAKQFKLCYCCLGDDHRGQHCTRTRICGTYGCQDTPNRLLHRRWNPGNQKSINKGIASQSQPKVHDNNSDIADSVRDLSACSTEGEQRGDAVKSHTATTMISDSSDLEHITLRTVPVVLKHGNRKLKVNALLDDASTGTYINADVADELGLQGDPRNISVNVLNGQMKTFKSTTVEVGLESIDGRVNTKISALTTNRVTDLHYSYRDVRGQTGEPIARLTPLGWTCIGNPNGNQGRTIQTNFVRTYFTHGESTLKDINVTLRKFLEVENLPSLTETRTMSIDDQAALRMAERSLKLENGRYQVGIPWKENAPELLDNYDMALHRLRNTEQRLKKNQQIAAAYSENLRQYVDKGYIRKIDPTEEKPKKIWYLPHIPVLRPDKATTKTRIVFDASARHYGISLNDVIYQGPKLQHDLFEVLLRFRRNPVALVSDIAEMYLRIEIPPDDRPCHRFLWRDLEEDKAPDEYEFTRVVFGVNCSQFLAQFVTQTHAKAHTGELPMAAETVLKSTYMDDSMDSVKTVSDGMENYLNCGLWQGCMPENGCRTRCFGEDTDQGQSMRS